MGLPIYLDYQATTPTDPRVLEAMLPTFTREFGNPASRQHGLGRRAQAAVEHAREQVAALIGANPAEIVFTSGATEAINLALKGLGAAYRGRKGHLVTSMAEHKAVLDTCRALERHGLEVTYLKPDATARVDPERVEAALREDTLAVALIWANNEVGTLNPIRDIGALCRGRGILLLSDATQAVGKVPIDLRRDPVDLLCISAHKLYGPKGSGALYVRRRSPRIRLEPLLHGGGHERGLRSGTLNVPGIVGLGAACEIAAAEMDQERERTKTLRDHLYRRLTEALPGIHLNGHPTERLAQNLNLSFEGIEAEALLLGLPDVALSSGSACTSANLEPSHVLRSMGVGDDLAHGSIRFSLGRPTTLQEIDRVADRVIETVRLLRADPSTSQSPPHLRPQPTRP